MATELIASESLSACRTAGNMAWADAKPSEEAMEVLMLAAGFNAEAGQVLADDYTTSNVLPLVLFDSTLMSNVTLDLQAVDFEMEAQLAPVECILHPYGTSDRTARMVD